MYSKIQFFSEKTINKRNNKKTKCSQQGASFFFLAKTYGLCYLFWNTRWWNVGEFSKFVYFQIPHDAAYLRLFAALKAMICVEIVLI